MTLIIGIVLTAVFYIVSANAIKKHPGVFYIGIYVWCGLVVFYFNMGYDKNFPEWFNEYFMNIFARGIFSTATFMVVMFLGTYKTQQTVKKAYERAWRNIDHW